MTAASDRHAIDAIAAKFQRGDLVGARADCEHFLSITSDSRRQSAARFWLGAIEARSGAHRAAAEQFELGLAVNRRDPFWLLQAGLTHFHLGNPSRAEQLYRDALRLEPRAALVHYNLGVLLQQKADAAGARRAFEAALTHHPQFAEAHTNLANTLLALGDTESAEAHYRQALAINPQLALAHHGLGLHHLRHQQIDAAIRCFKAAVEHNPEYLDAWLDLAECQHVAGNDEQAVASTDQVLARQPDHAAAQFKRAQFSGQQPDGVPREAIERLYAGMAGTFDTHLTQRLGYRIPALLIDELAPWLGEFAARNRRLPTVLDLGCGTGLFGAAVRPYAATLTGVDLSAAMLAKAHQRACYDALIENDLMAFFALDNWQAAFDLVVATDVLIYMGRLDALFPMIAARMSRGSRLAFSTESPKDFAGDYHLEASGRFIHGAGYIARLAETAGFNTVKQIATIVRTENAVPLDGHVFILERR